MNEAETILVVTAVVAAASYLLGRAWRRLSAQVEGSCCGRCPVARPEGKRP